jgi:hypothetical protein
VFIKLVKVLQMFCEDGLVLIREEGDITSSARGPFINATLYLMGIVSSLCSEWSGK